MTLVYTIFKFHPFIGYVKKISLILLCFIFISGCSTTLKQGWRDFNAYYNTHYNAKKYYSEGLEKNTRQIPDINPEIPIRVHLKPTRNGAEDFLLAIDKGADILRKHDQSRFVEPAILLIGKSFYYRSEYFASLEKFQELYNITDNPAMMQESVLWMGRVYLEMELYDEASQILETELELIENWDPRLRAETQAMLAQTYVKQQNWERAAMHLGASIDNLGKRDMRARAFFLYGQILERLDELDEAFMAYGRVEGLHPPYNLIYNANRKQAEIARRSGDYDLAFRLFDAMERDGKNFEVRTDLLFEIARTEQLRGNTDQALNLYQRVLHNQLRPPRPLIVARTHAGIAEIYRFQKGDYIMAAAYYDSAAAVRVDQALLPAGFNARELATSFGDYSVTRKEINRLDSLLTLGQMDPATLDSVLTAIQEQRLREMNEEQRRQQSQRDVMVTVDTEAELQTADQISSNGFLNVRNPAMLADAALQFQALWDQRPLVDNWRRQDAVASAIRQQEELADENGEVAETDIITGSTTPDIPFSGRIQMDISEIPFTEKAQDSMRNIITDQHYRMGNVFFLSLNMPDSARYYFSKVVNSGNNPLLIPQSLYTLTEIELLLENRAEAEKWAGMLASAYPGSVFTRRVSDRVAIDIQPTDSLETPDANPVLALKNIQNEPDPAIRGSRLRQLAIQTDSDKTSPLLLFDAARDFMKAARTEHNTDEELNTWYRMVREWDEQQNLYKTIRDSAAVMLTKSSLDESEKKYWTEQSELMPQSPDFYSIFPFRGAYWDSTRSVLNHIDTYYSSNSIMPQVTRLQLELRRPAPAAAEDTTVSDQISTRTEAVGNLTLPTCKDLGEELEIIGGMDALLARVVYPAWTQGVTLRGEIEYEFIIRADGTFEEYTQIGSMTRVGIPQAFERVFDEHLRFNPMGLPDGVDKMVCRLIFPVDLSP